ncbi:hypothetical protein [Paraburkholderia hayleyella]|uniref:hypothetical protein n=1 Tax=Paraburkholderia hayleyella TaxID=2152889 RepID=UPI001290FD88|nr:hypothetical protein [Paraburkholderia hayleyella]
MPILLLLVVLAALAYGALWSFETLAAQFGLALAVGVAVLAAALLLLGAIGFWRRQRAVAPNVHDGNWTHALSGPWGELRFAADKRLCKVKLAGDEGAYIFADLRGAAIEREGEGWRVELQVNDAARPVWRLPVKGKRQARQWQRIIRLAVAQRL